jgi:hypothetical protein
MMNFMKEGKNFLRAKKLRPKTKSLLRIALPLSVSLSGSPILKTLKQMKFPVNRVSNLAVHKKKVESLI